MHIKQIVGLVSGFLCVAIGVYFMVTGYKSMDGTKEKIKKKMTGSYSEAIRYNMIGGVAFVVVGAGLLFYFRGKKL